MKRTCTLFIIVFILTGCTFGNPEWRHGTACYFLKDEMKEDQAWNVTIRVFHDLKKEDPISNSLIVTYLNNQAKTPEKVYYEIPLTKNKGTIKLSGDSGKVTFKDKGIINLIKKTRMENGGIPKKLMIKLTWDGNTEILNVPANEGIKKDSRTKAEKFRGFFRSLF
jgi:hypothetical protein